MSDISMNIDRLLPVSEDLVQAGARICASAQEAAERGAALSKAFSHGEALKGQILALSRTIDSLGKKTASLGEVMRSCASCYRREEEKLCHSRSSGTPGRLREEGFAEEAPMPGSVSALPGAAISGSVSALSGARGTSSAIRFRKKTVHMTDTFQAEIREGKTTVSVKEKTNTSPSAFVGEGKSASVVKEYENIDIITPVGTVEATIGRAEAEASYKAGLYRVGEDDKKFLNPSLTAGASASALFAEATFSESYGNGVMGASVTGSASVLKGEAEADFKASLFNKKGNIAPKISASVSAEAVAAEAKAEATGKFAGLEATVKAGVNVGVGAHASFKVEGGKISCEAGASLGFGASFGFEIDTSGAVDAIVSTCQSVFDFFTK